MDALSKREKKQKRVWRNRLQSHQPGLAYGGLFPTNDLKKRARRQVANIQKPEQKKQFALIAPFISSLHNASCISVSFQIDGEIDGDIRLSMKEGKAPDQILTKWSDVLRQVRTTFRNQADQKQNVQRIITMGIGYVLGGLHFQTDGSEINATWNNWKGDAFLKLYFNDMMNQNFRLPDVSESMRIMADAVRAHGEIHGTYPEKLNDLKPILHPFYEEVIMDPNNGKRKPLVYRKPGVSPDKNDQSKTYRILFEKGPDESFEEAKRIMAVDGSFIKHPERKKKTSNPEKHESDAGEKKNKEQLPGRYLKIEKDGITVYVRPKDRKFLMDNFDRIKFFRQTFLRKRNKWELDQVISSLKQMRQEKKQQDEVELTDEEMKKVRKKAVSLLILNDNEEKRFQTVFQKTRNIQKKMKTQMKIKTIKRMADRFSFRRVKIVDKSDMKHGRVPFFHWDQQNNLRFKMSLDMQDPDTQNKRGESNNSSDESASDLQTKWNRATVVFQGTTAKGNDWENVHRKLRKQLKQVIRKVQRKSPETPNAIGSYWRPFYALQNAIKFSIMSKYQINTLDLRWFYDGVANLLTYRALNTVLQEDEIEMLPYRSPKHQRKFEAKKKSVNLLAWPAERFDSLKPIENSSAHSYFATYELLQLVDRHGFEKLQTVLRKLKEHKRIHTGTVCQLIEQEMNEDFLTRLRSYSPSLPGLPDNASEKEVRERQAELEEQYRTALKNERHDQAISILQSLVAHRPRNALYHNRLARAYLLEDPIRNVQNIIYHFVTGQKLSDVTDQEVPDDFFNKSNPHHMYVGNRMMLFIKKYKPAEMYLKRAISLDPTHDQAKKYLKKIRKKREQSDNVPRKRH